MDNPGETNALTAASDGSDGSYVSRIHTEEYRSRLRERGAPHGDHILQEDDDVDRRPHLYPDTSLAFVLAELKEMQEKKQGSEGKNNSIRFDWSFNLGHIVAILTVVCAAFASYYGIKGELQHDNDERAALTHRIEVIEVARTISVPKLEEQTRHSIVLDDEINALREGIIVLRQTVADQARNIADLTKIIYEANEKVSILQERVNRGMATSPHDK